MPHAPCHMLCALSAYPIRCAPSSFPMLRAQEMRQQGCGSAEGGLAPTLLAPSALLLHWGTRIDLLLRAAAAPQLPYPPCPRAHNVVGVPWTCRDA